jgi:hypothetical protein
MPLSRLELVSSYGDQSIGRARYVLYSATHATDAITVLESGLAFVEGKPIVSTNFVFAHDLVKQVQVTGVGEPGSVMVTAVPPNYHVGYGIFTSAYIDMQLKRVSGSPIRYAAGRKQLSLYAHENTEESRVHVEAEVANGYSLDQRPHYLLEPKYVIGVFYPNEAFDTLISELDVSARSLEAIRFERLEASFREVLRAPIPANAALVPSALHELVLGTIESALMSRLRMMRWQGLALLGYRFMEGERETKMPPVKDIAEQRREMDDVGRLLASSSLFNAELGWLKTYAARELDKMRVELDGAELRSLPD